MCVYIIYIYDLFLYTFIHWCCHVLAIMSNGAMNMKGRYLLQTVWLLPWRAFHRTNISQKSLWGSPAKLIHLLRQIRFSQNISEKKHLGPSVAFHWQMLALVAHCWETGTANLERSRCPPISHLQPIPLPPQGTGPMSSHQCLHRFALQGSIRKKEKHRGKGEGRKGEKEEREEGLDPKSEETLRTWIISVLG